MKKRPQSATGEEVEINASHRKQCYSLELKFPFYRVKFKFFGMNLANVDSKMKFRSNKKLMYMYVPVLELLSFMKLRVFIYIQ